MLLFTIIHKEENIMSHISEHVTGCKIMQQMKGLIVVHMLLILVLCKGSIAITGAAVKWLRDNLGIIKSAKETEELGSSVQDNGDVYFVPAFSGLFAPHWESGARGYVYIMFICRFFLFSLHYLIFYI